MPAASVHAALAVLAACVLALSAALGVCIYLVRAAYDDLAAVEEGRARLPPRAPSPRLPSGRPPPLPQPRAVHTGPAPWLQPRATSTPHHAARIRLARRAFSRPYARTHRRSGSGPSACASRANA